MPSPPEGRQGRGGAASPRREAEPPSQTPVFVPSGWLPKAVGVLRMQSGGARLPGRESHACSRVSVTSLLGEGGPAGLSLLPVPGTREGSPVCALSAPVSTADTRPSDFLPDIWFSSATEQQKRLLPGQAERVLARGEARRAGRHRHSFPPTCHLPRKRVIPGTTHLGPESKETIRETPDCRPSATRSDLKGAPGPPT